MSIIHLAGQVHHLRAVVAVPPPQLPRRDPAVGGTLPLRLLRIPGRAVHERHQPGVHLPPHIQGIG